MIILIPFLIAVLGAAVYGFAANPKAQELGRLSYGCGLLVGLFEVAGHVVSLLK